MKKNKVKGYEIEFVEKMFDALYEVMMEEGADPDKCCYAVSSVHTDIRNIVLGKLKPAKSHI